MSRLAKIMGAETLDELWALIPQPEGCDGSCHASCGPLGFGPAETERIAAAGVKIANIAIGEKPSSIDCPALDAANRCSIYADRPTLCRIWGVTGAMPCMANTCYTAHPLSDEEARATLFRSRMIGQR